MHSKPDRHIVFDGIQDALAYKMHPHFSRSDPEVKNFIVFRLIFLKTIDPQKTLLHKRKFSVQTKVCHNDNSNRIMMHGVKVERSIDHKHSVVLLLAVRWHRVRIPIT